MNNINVDEFLTFNKKSNINNSNSTIKNPTYSTSSNLLKLLKARKEQNINIDISMFSNKGSLTNLIEKAKKFQIPCNPFLSKNKNENLNVDETNYIKEKDVFKNKNKNNSGLLKNDIENIKKLKNIKKGNINKNKNHNINDNIDLNHENLEETNTKYLHKNYDNLNNESKDINSKILFNNNNGLLSNETSTSGALTRIEQISNKERSDNLSDEEDDINTYSSSNNKINNNYCKNYSIEYETTKEKYFIESCNCILEYSFREDQNIDSQSVMEDKSKSIENFDNNINQMLFLMFDGHGGDDISNFLQQNFSEVYKKYLDIFKYDIPKSLTYSFKEADKIIKEPLIDIKGMGSTGTIIHIVWENETTLVVYTGNIGDSRACLISKDHIIRLSYDHRMTDNKEKERIVKSGLEIINGRIEGELMLTRVFGDYEFKKENKENIKGVICEPFLSKIKIDLNIKNQYIILASDGIWDLISEKEIQLMIKGNNIINTEKLCALIIKKALDKDSWDNMSVFAIKIT